MQFYGHYLKQYVTNVTDVTAKREMKQNFGWNNTRGTSGMIGDVITIAGQWR
jgi:hypothetical protein